MSLGSLMIGMPGYLIAYPITPKYPILQGSS
jgi:hypothetical protein